MEHERMEIRAQPSPGTLELWIDKRKLHPGDYNRAEAPSSDARVWTETGCTCVLITSTEDILR